MPTSASWVVVGCLLSLHFVCHGTTAAAGEQSAASPADKVTEFRIRSQNLHADYIEKELEKLDNKLSEWTEPSAEEVAKVKSRIQRLEKPRCRENELDCGDRIPQCVHHLLVCDGVQDCRSGHDECNDTCGNLIQAGSAFTGIIHADEGILIFNRPVTLAIQGVHRSPVFPSHLILRGIFTAEYEGQVYAAAFDEGRFVYATRRLHIPFTDLLSYRYNVQCDFLLADDDTIYCHSYLEASNRRYSSYILKRA